MKFGSSQDDTYVALIKSLTERIARLEAAASVAQSAETLIAPHHRLMSIQGGVVDAESLYPQYYHLTSEQLAALRMFSDLRAPLGSGVGSERTGGSHGWKTWSYPYMSSYAEAGPTSTRIRCMRVANSRIIDVDHVDYFRGSFDNGSLSSLSNSWIAIYDGCDYSLIAASEPGQFDIEWTDSLTLSTWLSWDLTTTAEIPRDFIVAMHCEADDEPRFACMNHNTNRGFFDMVSGLRIPVVWDIYNGIPVESPPLILPMPGDMPGPYVWTTHYASFFYGVR